MGASRADGHRARNVAKTAGGVGCRIVPQGEAVCCPRGRPIVPLSLNAITAAAQSTVDFPFAIEDLKCIQPRQ